MLSALPLLLVLLATTARLGSAQACADSNTNSTSGFNSDCPNGRPYCIGTCAVCSATALDRFYCDCPSGQGCQRDYTKPALFSTCGVYPKYGSVCAQDSDCTTVYSPSNMNIYMPCVAGRCRYCDPVASANVTHVCDVRQSQYPGTKICIQPGVWGVAGQSSSSSSTTTTFAAATASTGSGSSGSSR